MTSSRPKRAGFTLIELTSIMLILSVILAVGVGIVAVARQADRMGESLDRRVTWRTDLAEQFRADVARAADAPDSLGGLIAGPACLILRMPDGGQRVYRWDRGKLTRAERDGRSEKPLPLAAVPAKVTGEFVRNGKLIGLRLTEPVKHTDPQTIEFWATLGGTE